MARNGGFGVYLEHLFTGVNSMESRKINVRDLSFAIRRSSFTFAPSKSSPMTPDMSPHS
jgi:hypothetical protein